MINNVVAIIRKEYLEISSSVKKLSLVMFLPCISIYFIAKTNGEEGFLPQEMSIMTALLIGGVFANVLIKDSITREKSQRTLEILLTSKVPLNQIIFGKIASVVIIGTVAEILQVSLFYYLLQRNNSIFLGLVTPQSLIIIPFIIYLMGAITLSLTIIINDDKVSDLLAIGISFSVSLAVFYLSFKSGLFNSWIISIVGIFIISFIDFILTYICSIILRKSLLYIKI